MKFEEALTYADGIVSGVTAAEARVLYDLASDVHRMGSGSVVEVGSYTGKSTIILGATGPVYAIDHHRGNAEHQPDQARCRPAVLGGERVDSFPIFNANLMRSGR